MPKIIRNPDFRTENLIAYEPQTTNEKTHEPKIPLEKCGLHGQVIEWIINTLPQVPLEEQITPEKSDPLGKVPTQGTFELVELDQLHDYQCCTDLDVI